MYDMTLDELEKVTGGQHFPPASNKQSRRHFRLVTFGEYVAEMSPIEWIVEGFIERHSFGVVYGGYASFKSFFISDIAFCIANGIPWHGCPVEMLPVIYICGEGHSGVKRRLKGLCIRYGVDESEITNFHISNTSIQLFDHQQLLLAIEAIDDVIEIVNQPPGLIIIDTLARNFGGSENSNDDVSQFIANLDQIRAAYKSTIILIHHSGHGDKGRSRGASALAAACDFQYEINRQTDEMFFSVKCKKMKDAEPPLETHFEAVQQDLPIVDRSGDPLTTLVIQRCDEPQIAFTPAKLGAAESRIFNVLKQMFDLYRKNLDQGGYDPSQARVELRKWSEECQENGLIRKQGFYSAKNGLVKKGKIVIEGCFVRIPDR